jgi:cyclohexyl-isocyanide hydratase
MIVGMLLYPRLTQLDLTGPYEVFTRMTGARVELLWKEIAPVVSDSGLSLLPTATLSTTDSVDILFVPGGPGQIEIMEDDEVLGALRRLEKNAQYVTSVCTGSLILAAAGLLDGYRAACHWMAREFLATFGVEVSPDRVVIDGNRVTGGGVTAGIDFALVLCALLRGEAEAKRIQLQIEYNPAPPFDSGSPESAEASVVAEVRRRAAALLEARRASTRRAVARRG